MAQRQGSRSLMLRIASDQAGMRSFDGAADRLRGILSAFEKEPETLDTARARRCLPAAEPRERWLD